MDSDFPNEGIHDLEQDVFLDAMQAPLDSQFTPGTLRAEILQQISSWIDDPRQTSQILWVYGEAVSEGTFIAQNVIDTCRSSNLFGASFFFQREIQGRVESVHLFPTIAYQLAVNMSGLRKPLLDAASGGQDPSSISMSHKFHSLIARPLQNLALPPPNFRVIVIDRFDECDDTDNAQQIILDCIADSASLNLPLRFLITSRNQRNIRQAFDSDRLRSITVQIALQGSDEMSSRLFSSHSPTHDKPSIPLPHSSRPRRTAKPPLQFPSYPCIVTLQRRNGHEESYCRSLLLAGHGFPMWKPSGNLAMPVEYLRKGVNIGDVGIIDNYGFFRCYFNIFLPPDHPIHKGFTPREFHPIEPPLQPDEIRSEKEYFKPGHVVASKGVIISRHSENPLDIYFTSTEPDGGILILPAGASREDLTSTDRFHEYARKNGPHWYQYINHYGRTSHANGSLFLVTGCDKAYDWAIASFPYRSGNTEDTLDLRYTWKPDSKSPWIDPGTAETNFYAPSKKVPNDSKEANQCVFLRGLRISLTQKSWQKTLPLVEEAKRHYSFILHTPSKFQLRLDAILVFLHLRFSEKKAVNIITARNQHLFHPNYVISQVLLAKYPDAELALVNDNVWCSLVDNGLCTIPAMNELVAKILHLNKIVENNGVVSLQSKTSDELEQLQDKLTTFKRFDQHSLIPFSMARGTARTKKKPTEWVKSVPVYKHAKLF